MRITFVTASADLGGGARVIAIYAQRLQRRGHRVTILSRPNKPASFKSKVKAVLRGRPLTRVAHVAPSHFDTLDGVEYRRISNFRPIAADDVPNGDVVIATWWETAEWVEKYPASKGAKVYFIQHFYSHTQDARMLATWRLGLKKIVISRTLLDVARNKYGDSSCSLVPNAVDLDQFNAPVREKQAIPTVGTIFSHWDIKGSDIVFQAYELARLQIPQLKLICFGHRAPSPQSAFPSGAEFYVSPSQDQIKNLYARCDVWLVGSRLDGFGLPILEAMACRTPVIATPAGAAPELLASGGGVLVPHEDHSAMAEAVQRIVRLSQNQWKELSNQAHQIAAGYTWDDATDLFEAALVEAVEKSASNSRHL